MQVYKTDVVAKRAGVSLRFECPVNGTVGAPDASGVSLEFELSREQAVSITAQLMQALEPHANAPDAGGFHATS